MEYNLSTRSVGILLSSSRIYRQTWEQIQDNLLLHMSKGEPVNAVSDSRIGSHSVILGSLLYRTGLVGTGIFIVFWISLFIWFYETSGRP